MKAKAQTPQETSEKIKLDFDPPLPEICSVVNQIMPDGTKDRLGYVMREEYNGGKDFIYRAYDLELKCICYSSEQQEIETSFEKYSRRLSRNERAKEIKKLRNDKGRDEKSKSLSK